MLGFMLEENGFEHNGGVSGKSLLLWFLLCGALAGSLQLWNGAYSSDLGADPDEPAHAVTALMLRDYLAEGLWAGEHPLRFAAAYYERLPKVALGHYPPGFYALAGLWLLPLPSPGWLMVLMAMLVASLASITTVLGLHCGLGRKLAGAAGLGFILLPLSQDLACLVMSDSLLSCGLLLSTWQFARFMEKPTALRSLSFGALAAATILTKGSGVALALVPVGCIVLLHRWSLLSNWRLWLGALPVLLTAVPWILGTMHITQEGMSGIPVRDYIPIAAEFYAGAANYCFGPALLIVAAVGACLAFRRGLTPLPVALGVLFVAVVLLYLVSPTGTSSRYLLPLAPPLLLAAASIGRRLEHKHRRMVAAGLLLLSGLTWLAVNPSQPKQTTGYSRLIAKLAEKQETGRILVVSDARGEGGVVAAVAFGLRSSTKPWSVLRGSKFLSVSDWIGRNYVLKYSDSSTMQTALKEAEVDFVVIDTGVPELLQTEHHRLALAWAANREVYAIEPAVRQESSSTSELRAYRL
jgi:hypothetical protein